MPLNLLAPMAIKQRAGETRRCLIRWHSGVYILEKHYEAQVPAHRHMPANRSNSKSGLKTCDRG